MTQLAGAPNQTSGPVHTGVENSSRPRALLFCSFEPSGDDHASTVIAELKARHPDLKIYAWGGPRMAAAGAEVVEQTGRDAVMGMPGLAKIQEHRRINERIEAWMDRNPIAAFVAVDSPAANFPICKLAKKRGIRVVHLVAPQVWAWGKWRVKKLRRLTDMVLCLLPFEEKWFEGKDVPAKFVGHPLFDIPLDDAALDAAAARMPQGSPKIALLPGSRPKEHLNNFPILLESFKRLKADRPETVGVVAATTPEVAESLRETAKSLGGWPDGLSMEIRSTDAVVRWCDLALVVSGTVTLQIARQQKPMVIVYKTGRLFYELVGRWILTAPFFTLPNLIAGRRIVPELVPHFGDAEPIVQEASRLIEDESLADQQRQELSKVVEKFAHLDASVHAADAIERVAGLRAQAV
ncbi:MAG: lipid-A-disaccharide synthase [Phycisphaerales bacterium]|nr:lipid-A-disaccharide synthase [Phycisphaerales bacterium]MCB9836808.1 lipid-A-disaccharide synthase [Phycisphaera sp.]